MAHQVLVQEFSEETFDENIYAPIQPTVVQKFDEAGEGEDIFLFLEAVISNTVDDGPAIVPSTLLVPLQRWELVSNTNFAAVHQLNLIASRKDESVRPDPLILLSNPTAKDLIMKLSSAANTKLVVFGPPGSGKSTITYLWMQFLAAKRPDIPRVWISLSVKRMLTFYHGYVSVENVTLDQIRDMKIDNIKLKYVDDTGRLRNQRGTIGALVVDGIKSSEVHYLPIVVWARYITNVKFITSERTLSPDLRSISQQYCITPWTFANYMQLCSNDAYFQSIVAQLGGIVGRDYSPDEKERLLRYKYFYAGRNPRFMLEYSVENVKQDLSNAISRIKNDRTFLSFFVGEKQSSDAVNTLLVKDGLRPELVSEYVLWELQSKIERSQLCLLLLQNEYIRNSKCMDGWAIEADFIYSVKHNLLLEPNRVKNVAFAPNLPPAIGTANTTYGRINHYHFHRNAPETLLVNHIMVDSWYIPEVHNPDGFDAVQVCAGRGGSPFVLRFVQVVRQLNHVFKIEYMRICLRKFNEVLQAANFSPITLIEIIVAYPEDLVARVPNPADAEQLRLQGMSRTGNPVVEFGVVLFKRLEAVPRMD